MAEGLFSRFKPGEDRGMSDPTWGGGKLGAPSVTDFNPLVPLAGIPIGYGAYGGYKGAQALNLARKEALDLISKFDPGRRKALKNIAGTVGKGLVDLSPVITWPLKDLQVPNVPSETVGTAVSLLKPYFDSILTEATHLSSVPIERDSNHYPKPELSPETYNTHATNERVEVDWANRGMKPVSDYLPSGQDDLSIGRQNYRALDEGEKQRVLNSGNLGRAADEIDKIVDYFAWKNIDKAFSPVEAKARGLKSEMPYHRRDQDPPVMLKDPESISYTLRALTRMATWFRNPEINVIPLNYRGYIEGQHAPEFELREMDRTGTGPLGGDTLTKFFNTVVYTGDKSNFASRDEYLTDQHEWSNIFSRGTQPLDWEYKGKLGWRDYQADNEAFEDAGGLNTPISEPIYTQNRIVGTGARIYHKLLAANDAAIAIEWLQGNDPKLLLEIIDQILTEEVRTRPTFPGSYVPEDFEKGFVDFLETLEKETRKRM